MSTPEDRRAAWIALMSSLEAQLTATRENARAHAVTAKAILEDTGHSTPGSTEADWEATAWAAAQLLRDLRVIPAPVVPRDDETGQATLDDLIKPSSTPGDESVEEPDDGRQVHWVGEHGQTLHLSHNLSHPPHLTQDAEKVTCRRCLHFLHAPVIDGDGDTWTRQEDGTWKGTWGPAGRQHSTTLESRQAIVEAFGESGSDGECDHLETRRFREGHGGWHVKCLGCGIVTDRGTDLPRDAGL